jgi:4-carboxymuconolactone decarboxylase
MNSERDRLLVETVVLAALGRRAELASLLAKARRDGVEDALLREALLQVLPYAGYPRAMSALEVLAEVSGAAPEEASDPDSNGLRARGETTFRAVYGEDADGILERIRHCHPRLEDWLLADAYGKVLSRPGLDLADREVLGVALLTALDQPRQLQGHLRGGLRVGAQPSRLRAAVETAAGMIAPDAADRARNRLKRELD